MPETALLSTRGTASDRGKESRRAASARKQPGSPDRRFRKVPAESWVLVALAPSARTLARNAFCTLS